jgi:hypothetical protein
MADLTTNKSYNYYWQSAKFKDLVFSGSLISQFVNDKGYVTSSVAISASYALTASYVKNAVSASYFSGSVSNAISASYATTASYVRNAISASYATTASYAATSSYAMNGGVTQLLAGPNVTLSPTNGLGQVTVSATLSGSTVFNTATGSYGSFYDTTTQTNPVANIPRSMSFNTTDITNGVSISGSTNPFNTYIKTQNAGVYNIQFSAQLDKTDSGADEIVIWLRKNGINLTDTATSVTLSGNNAKNVAAWNWFVNSAANDYYQIIWQSADTNVRLFAEPTDGHPGIPSVIVTANRVDQFLSNTGSFSGSFTGGFTGSLQGTATTASSVTNLNQSVTIGKITSTPSTENTLNVYPSPAGGTGEGGQILLAASEGLYTSASMLDTYQNQFRLLKGTNTGGSTVAYIITDLQSGNTQFAGAVTASAYSGLPNAWMHGLRSGNQTIGSGTWANRDIIFNDVSSNNFTYNSSTGIATLRAGKTYRITSRLAWAAAGVYVLQFRIYNQTTSAFVGPTAEIIQSTNGTNNISDGTLEHIFAVGASDVDISIRTTNITNALTGEYIRGDLNTQLIIQQIS